MSIYKNFSERIIEEAICRTLPAQNINNTHQRYNDGDYNDGREFLLDDVTEVLNEIYHTLVKDYKLRFKKP